RAKYKIIKNTLSWLISYKKQVRDDSELLEEVKLKIQEYRMFKARLYDAIKKHRYPLKHDELSEEKKESFLLLEIIEMQRMELERLWRNEEINLAIRNKLLNQLDHGTKRFLV